MQSVQTRLLLTFPFMTIFCLLKFGLKVRRVFLWEWLMVLPFTGFLPQITHLNDIVIASGYGCNLK